MKADPYLAIKMFNWGKIEIHLKLSSKKITNVAKCTYAVTITIITAYPSVLSDVFIKLYYKRAVIDSHGCGVRCSSMVKAFAHVMMGSQIDPSWWTH